MKTLIRQVQNQPSFVYLIICFLRFLMSLSSWIMNQLFYYYFNHFFQYKKKYFIGHLHMCVLFFFRFLISQRHIWLIRMWIFLRKKFNFSFFLDKTLQSLWIQVLYLALCFRHLNQCLAQNITNNYL